MPEQVQQLLAIICFTYYTDIFLKAERRFYACSEQSIIIRYNYIKAGAGVLGSHQNISFALFIKKLIKVIIHTIL
jgi:hypothetical protein